MKTLTLFKSTHLMSVLNNKKYFSVIERGNNYFALIRKIILDIEILFLLHFNDTHYDEPANI